MANNFLTNGLLGLGGIGGGSMPASGLLGDFYDPNEMRKYQMKQMLLGLGAGLLAEKGIGKGAALALAAGDRAGQTYRDNAMDAYKIKRQQEEDAYTKQQRELEQQQQQQQQQAMDAALGQLPPGMQTMAKAFPNAVIPNYVKQTYFPDPQRPEEDKLYNVGGTLVNSRGQIVFQNQQQPAGQNMNPTELKAVFAAEDEMPALQGTKEALQRALELNDKTYTGMGAGTAGYIGANVPGGSMVFDENKSKNTLEWQKIMSMEAIQAMSASLKGATTDFELRKFEEILADPATPADIRKRTIQRMMQLADRKQQMLTGRLDMLKRQPSAPQGGNDPLSQARAAIAAGADPEAVRQRLMDNGIDPSGL